MTRIALCIAGVLAALQPALAADTPKFFSDGKYAVEARYRLETVDQDGFAQSANANTVRFRLTLPSGAVAGFSAVVEADDLESVFSQDYNSTRNGHTQYPTVADPPSFDLNQAYLQFAGLPKTVIKAGRQRIRLDNERFIGAVGWRQNEQTYDAFSIENKGLPKTTITYAYIDTVRRVFGPDAGTPPPTFEGSSHVANVKYAGLPFGNLTAYDYYLDFSNQAQLSSNTYGLRFDGSHKIGQKASVSYALEYAEQTDVGDNLADINAHYLLAELGGKYGPVGALAGYEVLSGEQGTFAANRNPAFQTPLATLHKFQGWADKFLTTPSAGIEDLYFGGTFTWSGFNAVATWHEFKAEATSQDYGTEWNLSLQRKFGKHFDVLVKYADYSKDALFTDTTKFWLQVTATL
jgi:hypothetical protein